MATFYMNRRGGLTVDRDSLHASDGYKRQVEALDKLRERSMNAGLREAVEKLGKVLAFAGSENQADWQTIRQALRDQEAEIARLQNVADGNAELYQHELLRSEKADALLRECFEWLFDSMADGPRVSEGAIEKGYYTPAFKALHDRITAHLGGENNG